MHNKRFAVYIHRLYFEGQIKKGGLDQVLYYLLTHDCELIMFEFPLDYSQTRHVKISLVTLDHSKILKEFDIPNVRDSFKWLIEIFLLLTYSIYYAQNVPYIITSDPLSTLPAVLLRRIGFYKFHYYHSVDYSTDRFANKLLNDIYFILLRFGLRNADLIGVVTHAALDRLRSYTAKPMLFLPNSPSFNAMEVYRKPIDQRQVHSLVITCAEVSHKFLVHKMVELTGHLKEIYPDVHFHVIGHYDDEGQYYKDMRVYIDNHNLAENVTFHGNQVREQNYETISHCQIGLAFYDGNYSHVMYGDALKIREYCALGLAVVADTKTHTAVEMAEKGCGFALEDISEAYAHIRKLFDQADVYRKCVDSSLKYAQENDKERLMDNVVKTYFQW